MKKIILLMSVMIVLGIASESRAEVTCSWKKIEGTNEDSTELIISGSGTLSSLNCPRGYKSTVTAVSFAEGSDVTKIGDMAFFGATGLTSVTIPTSVTSIGASAFSGATSLTSVTFADGSKLESIGNYAFSATENLTSITIPGSVTSIGVRAFDTANDGTSGLINITFEDGSKLESIGSHAFNGTRLTSITIPETLSAENVALWHARAFAGLAKLTTINCVKADGTAGDESKCAAALAKYLNDEDGKCQSEAISCLRAQKINDTCVGQYFGSTANDGTCVTKKSCTGGGNFINTEARQCMTPASCTGMYVADTVNKKCFKMPGCVSYGNGACQECDSDYLTNSEGTCTPVADCKNGLHADNGACKANPEGCNTFANNKCTECNSGLLKQRGKCVSYCGANFRQNDGECDRIRYTPAEAAEILKDNGNIVTITFKM